MCKQRIFSRFLKWHKIVAAGKCMTKFSLCDLVTKQRATKITVEDSFILQRLLRCKLSFIIMSGLTVFAMIFFLRDFHVSVNFPAIFLYILTLSEVLFSGSGIFTYWGLTQIFLIIYKKYFPIFNKNAPNVAEYRNNYYLTGYILDLLFKIKFFF